MKKLHTALLGRRVKLSDIPRYSNYHPPEGFPFRVGMIGVIVNVYMGEIEPLYDIEVSPLGMDVGMGALAFDLLPEEDKP